MIKSLWKDPVWSAVIAAGLIAALGVIGTYFLGFWPFIRDAVFVGWKYLWASSLWPNWAIGLLIVTSFPTILLIILGLLELSKGGRNEPSEPSWFNYTQDTFFNLRWRWNYADGRIGGLTSYCPRCDFQVFPFDASRWAAVPRIGFHCDSCQSDLGEFQESPGTLESKVERFIQQKIRNQSWPTG